MYSQSKSIKGDTVVINFVYSLYEGLASLLALPATLKVKPKAATLAARRAWGGEEDSFNRAV